MKRLEMMVFALLASLVVSSCLSHNESSMHAMVPQSEEQSSFPVLVDVMHTSSEDFFSIQRDLDEHGIVLDFSRAPVSGSGDRVTYFGVSESRITSDIQIQGVAGIYPNSDLSYTSDIGGDVETARSIFVDVDKSVELSEVQRQLQANDIFLDFSIDPIPGRLQGVEVYTFSAVAYGDGDLRAVDIEGVLKISINAEDDRIPNPSIGVGN